MCNGLASSFQSEYLQYLSIRHEFVNIHELQVLAKFRRLLPCAAKRDDWLGGASHGTHVTVAETRRDDAVTLTTNPSDVINRLGRNGTDVYETVCDVIPMQDLGVIAVKGQHVEIGCSVSPSSKTASYN